MELRQLKYFLMVADEGQITKAANRLHITQPPLSQQMILLEKELGVQLIQRTKKHTQLTEAGGVLYKRGEQIMALVKTAVDEVQQAANGIRGNLTIGTITSAGRSVLPVCIQKFHDVYPLIFFDLHQGDTRRILELLDTGLIEIGFVTMPIDSSAYNCFFLPEENMVMVAEPHTIKLDEHEELRLDKFKNKFLLILRRYEDIILDYCRRAGFEPRILCTSDDVTPLLIWAKMGLGIAIVPEAALNLLQESPLLVRRITRPTIIRRSAMIWSKERPLSIAATHFIEMFEAENHHSSAAESQREEK